MKYYAFLEEIEDSGEELTLVFDSILHESVYKGKLYSNLQLIQTFQIIFSVNAKLLKSIYNRRNFLLDRWYEIETSKRNSGVKATRYNLSNDQKLEISIDSIKILDRRNRVQKELMKSSSLDFLPDADIDSISKLLPSLREDQNLVMKVMNVGQGNSVSFVEETTQQDLFYVDVGGGILRNRSSYKDSKIKYNPVEDALIILTHWDMDHWVSLIRKSDSLKNTKLLAPRQKPIGLSHVKLAADLESQNRLLIWPESNTEIIGELVDVYKLKKHSVRNYSGLVVVAKTEPWREKSALITGDAPYSKCDFLNRYDVNVVVVPHHGGRVESDTIPQAPEHHISAYSYGANNSYGHPHSETKIKHNKRGWNNEFNTVDSDILIINEKSVFSDFVTFHELRGSQVVNISNKAFKSDS